MSDLETIERVFWEVQSALADLKRQCAKFDVSSCSFSDVQRLAALYMLSDSLLTVAAEVKVMLQQLCSEAVAAFAKKEVKHE